MTEATDRILVVDDNRMNRIKLSRSLEQQGHAVGLAEGGEEALAMLRADGFDAVLLDIMMPGMDGYEVLEQIKADPALRDIPVIVISALDEVESAVRCIEMGAVDYLPKSFDPVLLRARLNASLQKKKLRDLEKAYLQQEVMLRQSEKLATLGRLSAGMAHELNNPAAAARRSAGELQATFSRLQEAHFKLDALQLTGAQLDLLSGLDRIAQTKAQEPVALDALARSNLEAEIESWLETNGIEGAWEIAPNLVRLGYGCDDLEGLSGTLTPAQLPVVIAWLDCTSAIYSFHEEISQATERISAIVQALKAYTFMDQAPVQDVDIHESLDNTLTILRDRLEPNIVVCREYAADLPQVEAYGSELNQVWTNIVDNAIHAMKGGGELTLRTRRDGDGVIVEIEDNGSGIPQDALPHIFDPFFTTRPPGQGTGMGLNICYNVIVQKHRGRLDVHTTPGRTCFKVWLPSHLASDGAQAGRKEIEST